MNRGEIRWYTFRPPDKRRPVLILTRNEVLNHLNEVIVVPATRTIRAITTEVVLSPEDGMPIVCALNFDHVSLSASGLDRRFVFCRSRDGLKCAGRFLSRAALVVRKRANTTLQPPPIQS